MKRAIFILLLALCVVSRHEAHAQRALPRMRSIELRGGMVDGFCTSASTDAGYYFGVAMSRYAKHADKWVFGVEYLSYLTFNSSITRARTKSAFSTVKV